MAKESFFIRGLVTTNSTTFNQASIDLGSYVDALGSAILRVHNITVQYGSFGQTITGTANSTAQVQYQLTTQSKAQMVDLIDKSLIASGRLIVSTGAAVADYIGDFHDVSPQMWTNGYLVGVEQIFLGVDQAASDLVDQVSIILECTVEKMSPSSAMALALSQQ